MILCSHLLWPHKSGTWLGEASWDMGDKARVRGQACQGWDTGEELAGTWPEVRLREAY